MDKEIEKMLEEERAIQRESIKNAVAHATNELSEQEQTRPNVLTPDDLIGSAFNQALVTKVNESDELKENLLNTAEKVIKNKTDAISSRAEEESKQAHFNNKKGACECFGYNEATTEKWAVNAVNVWHNIMTGIWLVIGCFTFAPITFIAKKITVIFKKSWVAILLAILIYLLVVFVPIIVTLITK